MGRTEIKIGDATSQVTIKDNIFEGGFHEMTGTTSGSVVSVYRESLPSSSYIVSSNNYSKPYTFNAIKLY